MAVGKPFEELQLPRKQPPEITGKYKIYRSSGECIEIAAATVLEALEASGAKDVIKVERALLSSIGIIGKDTLLAALNPPVAAEAPTV